MRRVQLVCCALCLWVCLPVRATQLPYAVRPAAENYACNSFTAVCQDEYGFMWLGTVQGLFRYDAYTYKSFTGEAYESLSLSQGVIRSLVRDSHGKIWVGTDLGASLYDPLSDRFQNLEGGISGRAVNNFLELPSGRIVSGTSRGVAVTDPATLEAVILRDSTDHNLIPDNLLHSALDSRGNVWMGGLNGFYRLSFDGDGRIQTVESFMRTRQLGIFAIDRFDRIWFSDGEQMHIAPIVDGRPQFGATEIALPVRAEAKSIVFDGDRVWIGSSYKGLYCFHMDSAGHISLLGELWVNPAQRNDLTNSITALGRDARGNIWLGTVGGAFIVAPQERQQFNAMTTLSHGLAHNVVSDVVCMPDGHLWASTSDGLCRIVMRDGSPEVTRYMNTVHQGRSVTDNRMQAMTVDGDGIMWVGTKRGVIKFNPVTGKFIEDSRIDDFLRSNDASFVKALLRDANGDVWIGLLYGGVVLYRHDTHTCHMLELAGRSLENANVLALTQDRQGNVWIGTKKEGLFRLGAQQLAAARRADTFSLREYAVYHHDLHHTGGLRSDWVNAIFCNRDNVVWAGTREGLYRYDPAADDFVRLQLNQLGGKEYVADMIEDFGGALWAFTTGGVYKYLPGERIPEYFELSNGGFARIDYIVGSCLDPRGRIYAGGINGVTWFDPSAVKGDTVGNRVMICDFSILNREVVPGDGHLKTNVNLAEGVTLTHRDSQISFSFSSLDYADQQKIRYCYRLEGFDQDWVYIPRGRNYIAYSNLPAGEYTLLIRATNDTGMWTTQARGLHIRVLPPWWATWWSYCLYALAGLGILLGTFLILRARYRYRQREQLNQWKQRFYVNVTHGFKTPLTMMQVPLDALLDSARSLPDGERRQMLSLIDKNVHKLSHLIRQLIEFRRLDQNKTALSLVESDVCAFVGMVAEQFRELCDSKGLTLKVEGCLEGVRAVIDPEKIETVLANLLLNAVTFTPRGGTVTVACRRDERQGRIYVSVSDTGIGIRPEYHNLIFERFWQAKDNSVLTPSGAGIGLALSKEMIELHHGGIGVQSEPGRGSTFTFWLHEGSAHFGHRQHIAIPEQGDEPLRPALTPGIVQMERDVEFSVHEPGQGARRVVIISSDGDMAALLRFILREYRLESFTDTETALESVTASPPELIVADTIARNKAQGVEFAARLKADIATSHIPIILLTAEDNREDIETFYRVGIDSFLEKPFDISHLQGRARQLMRSRVNVRENVRLEMILEPEGKVESADEKFMARVMEVIEKNMSNEAFSLVDFAAQMHVSRSVLHARLQALTSRSPIELLRYVRMQKAAQLLRTNAHNITQVSYMVGFSDSRYFSTSFKKQFGVTPREYMAGKGAAVE